MSQSIEAEVAKLLLKESLTLSAAESCTGGLLGHRLTNIPGSSSFFIGGVTAYSYLAKEKTLGIDQEILLKYGAVSEEIAIEMAQRARALFSTDYALSVTGIAGPGGGTPEKPVGLVYIGLASKIITTCRKRIWQGDRLSNKNLSVDAALTFLKETILHSVEEAI